MDSHYKDDVALDLIEESSNQIVAVSARINAPPQGQVGRDGSARRRQIDLEGGVSEDRDRQNDDDFENSED